VKKQSGSLEPDLLVVAVVTVLIRGSNRCGEFAAIVARMRSFPKISSFFFQFSFEMTWK